MPFIKKHEKNIMPALTATEMVCGFPATHAKGCSILAGTSATVLQHCRELAGTPATVLQHCGELAGTSATMLQHRLCEERGTSDEANQRNSATRWIGFAELAQGSVASPLRGYQ
jgi:hypothetical protein